MARKLRILVADDHTVVRKGLCSLLSAEKYGMQVVGEANDGQEAIALSRSLKPNVILMDLMMPRVDGIQATRAILEESPEAHILVLTSSGEEEPLRQAIDAGALGYMMKDASPDELVSSIQEVALGRMSLPKDLARILMSKDRISQTEAEPEPMTERELDVLRCLAKGYSNQQIAQELTVGTTTVRTHVSNLLRKLNLENRTQLALYARERKIL
jgi:NarL family two-component system response regulator LiaR